MLIDELLTSGESQSLSVVSALINENLPVVIFGSGNLGQKVAKALLSLERSLLVFSDNNPEKWGSEILNVKIIAPKSINDYLGVKGICIVAIWSPGHHYFETKKQLKDQGVKNIYHGAAILQLFPGLLLPHYHFQTPDYFRDSKEQIKEVYQSLADDESKRQYFAHLNCRINLDYENLPAADSYNQYFPELIALSKEEIFLDAGAYDGDTLREFIKRTNGNFKKYIALEPDPGNYKKLKAAVTGFKENQIEIYPFAVGNENATLKFNATGGEGAGVSENGTVEVDCKRIDDVFFDYDLTYLKFDIEGAELCALQGAERSVKKNRPKIAVCLYHLPNDLWTIPLLLKEFNPDYKLFVRTHSFDGFEFVLYAI